MKLNEILTEYGSTIAQHDAWAEEDVEGEAKRLVNKAVERVGDDLSLEAIIHKIKFGWRGLNPAVVGRAIEIVQQEA